jgi:phospholipid/cholesterol/gamma-HCH transport system ATP-binding protein
MLNIPAAPDSRDDIASLTDIRFGYDDSRLILDGVTMRFPRRKVIAIMGGSGCGKTTILRLLAGLYRPKSGKVMFNGEDVATLSHKQLYTMRRSLGFLFQFGALFTDMSVFENVAFPMREHTGMSDELIHDLVLMKLNAVGLRGAAHLRVNELSGGMSRRVALARAIALDPSLMLYDEPFTGLDPISLGVVGKLIHELNDALGTTSVLVTHDVVESLKIVDYVYFVGNGKILAQGTPDEVRATTDPFVKQFIHGEADGPVPMHMKAPPLEKDFLER